MESLKRLLAVAVCVTLCAGSAWAGDKDDVLRKAFADSYTLEKNGNYDQAINAIKAVYEESSYEMNLRLGWLHYGSGLFSESMTYYEKAMMLLPYAIEAKLGFALPAAALGNWTLVETRYREILNIDDKNTTVHYRLGLLCYGRKDYEEAREHFEVVANLYPFDYDGSVMLGWSYYQMGKLREAKVLFQKTLLIRPDDASALEGLRSIQ